MRMHFISRLALLLLAGFLVIASRVWTGATIEWLFIAAGIVMIFVAAIDAEAEGSAQRTLDAALAALATLGLVVHENSTERIVHELSVTRSERRAAPAPMPFPR
ncbi:hypothetical protein [Candidatus Solirubrobacter pratensis]|uniref:hypothetical protein n=1 Tax=Candidatus Solirubrobacter pratensis TaxID=1298857 RepID=UPI0012DEA1A2|nr:hypothetical protein [Candidatus Solirubrobacter pratensis]